MHRPSEQDASPSTPVKSLWRNRDFLLLWSGQAVSLLGTSISTLALPILVLALTHSPAQAGLIEAAQTIPYLLLSLPAGALVDRWNRKVVMIVCDLARLIAYGSVPFAYALGHLTTIQFYFVAFLSGTAFVFFTIANDASLPRVVPQAQLAQANALNASAESAAGLIGPGLSGFIISLLRTIIAGGVLAYLIDSLSYLVSGLSLGFMRATFQEKRASGQAGSLLSEVAQGLHFLWQDRRIRTLAFLITCIGIFSSPAGLALIVLAQQNLHTNVGIIGIIFSVGSAGGLLGSLIAGPIKRYLRFGSIIIATTVAEALAVALLAVAASPIMLMVGMGIISAAIPIFGVTQLSYRQSTIPDSMQGRTSSVFDMLFFGGQPLGAAIGGLLIGPLGPRAVLWGIALGLGLSALVVGLTTIRKV